MARRPQWRRASYRKARGRVCIPSSRRWKAAEPSSWMARRMSSALESAGRGAPKLTVTG